MGSHNEGWLSVELSEIKKDVKEWSTGLRESYDSLLAQSTTETQPTQDAKSGEQAADNRTIERR